MANEIIRPIDLPDRPNPVASEKMVVDNGSTVAGATIASIVDAGRPLASQVEAEAGVNATKAMTPLTTKQAIDAQAVTSITAGDNVSIGGTPSAPVISATAELASGDKGDVSVITPTTQWRINRQYDTVADLLADTGSDPIGMGYAGSGASVIVAPGDIVTAQGFRYEVLADDAVDWHVETAGGVKAIALPDAGGRMDPMSWAPAADGVTDDHSILQRFHDYCRDNGLFFSYPTASFYLSDTLTVRSDGDATRATFNVDGSFSPAVLVGSKQSTPRDSVRRLWVEWGSIVNISKTVPGWSGFDTSVGIEFGNLYEGRFYAKYVYGFGIGMWVSAYGTGNVYNTYDIGLLYDNKVNLLLQPGDDLAWVNENRFMSGWLAYSSLEGTNVPGTRQIKLAKNSIDGPYSAPNNNRFYGLSVEQETPEFHVDCWGLYNVFDLRWEATPPKVRLYGIPSAQTNGNEFKGYDAYSIQFTIEGNTNYNGMFVPRKTVLHGGGTTPAFQITNGASDARTAPHARGWGTLEDPIEKVGSDTDWQWEQWAGGLAGKRRDNSEDRLRMDWANSQILIGNGSVAPTAGLAGLGSAGMALRGDVYLPTRAGDPAALTGYAAFWFDGTDLKFRLPGGTIKTVTAT